MILVGGTRKQANKLPKADMIEYVVEANDSTLGIKLKTIARGPKCIAVYLNASQKDDFEIDDVVREKLVYYEDDIELVELLKNGGVDSTEELEAEPVVPTTPELQVFGVPTPTSYVPQTINRHESHIPQVGGFVIEDAKIELPEELFASPELNMDYDITQQQMQLKDKKISQLTDTVGRLQKEITELYSLQEIQLREMKDKYDKRAKEFNETIERLEKQKETMRIPDNYRQFLKFAPYSENPRAVLRDGFTETEMLLMGTLSSPFHIFASGSGDSLNAMLMNVNYFIESNPNAIIVDFTGNYFLNGVCKIRNPQASSLDLNDSLKSVESLIFNVGKTRFIPTTFYNDISLLSMNWANIMKKLNHEAKGAPIVMLFGSIDSFNVRYTITKLSNIGRLSIFVKSNPIILSTLMGNIQFMVDGRFQIIALDFIDIVKTFLENIGKRYSVSAYQANVDWNKFFKH